MKRFALGLAALAATLLFATALSAAAGDLDLTFAGDGTVVTDFEGGGYDVVWGVAVQRDLKILVAGETSTASSDSFAIVRYNANGALDPTFDGDGKVRTEFTASSFEQSDGLALQGDGKIVVAGYVRIPGSGTFADFALARYNPDGSLDTSFDGDGKVMTDFSSGGDLAFSVALQSDGKIVAVGISQQGVGPASLDVGVARYNPNGSLDPSFDGDGRAVTPIAAGSEDQALDVAVQADGKLLVAGSAYGAGNAYNGVLVRYAADGSLDTSFDGDGKVVLPSIGSRLALQSDGRIIITSSPGFSVTRFNSNGSIDTSFGQGGSALAPVTGSASAPAIQPDGKIVVAGSGAAGHNFAVARFQPGGSPDPSFGLGGAVETVLGGPAGSDLATDVGIALDGKIVVAGGSRPTSDGPFDFAVARYQAAPPPCKVPNVRGKKLAAAKTSIKKARCTVGKVARKASKRVKKGRVISQSPRAGASVPSGAKVNLVVSKGRKR
ncbi:MAG: PASTA domain-containing protein [Actinomycetota bacterium]